MKAPEILKRASSIMDERAKQYDSPEGERSMGKAVAAFNAITGHELSEADGWLLMALLKMVRDNTTDKPHEDSLHDLVAYAGLYGEARLAVRDIPRGGHQWLWHSGEYDPPVSKDIVVAYRLRNGDCANAEAGDLVWGHNGSGFDIIAYRVLK